MKKGTRIIDGKEFLLAGVINKWQKESHKKTVQRLYEQHRFVSKNSVEYAIYVHGRKEQEND